MKNISEAIQDFFTKNNYKQEMDIVRVWLNWDKIVGPELAGLAKPLGKQKQSLIIGVENSLIMQEIRFYSQQLLDFIYDFLQWQPFDKIKFELLYGKTSLDQIQINKDIKIQEPRHAHVADSNIGHLDFTACSIPSFSSCYKSYVQMIKELDTNK